eukprot:6317507-Pyramimonas_sp.AAC.1
MPPDHARWPVGHVQTTDQTDPTARSGSSGGPLMEPICLSDFGCTPMAGHAAQHDTSGVFQLCIG